MRIARFVKFPESRGPRPQRTKVYIRNCGLKCNIGNCIIAAGSKKGCDPECIFVTTMTTRKKTAMKPAEETAIQWLHDTIRVHLRARRDGKPSPVSDEWVGLCWDVGHSLAMMHAHGIAVPPVIEAVSAKLRLEFLGAKGLFPADLQLMRLFYLNYFERAQLLPKLRTIPWDRHALILERCRDPLQQEFYLELCVKENLNRDGLLEALKAQRYETSALPTSSRN